MRNHWKYSVISTLTLAALVSLSSGSRALEPVCYECAAKLCYEEFKTAAGAVDQQFEQERGDVEQHLAEIQLEAAKKAEVLGATEEVLLENAGQRKQIAFNGLRQCLAAN